MAWWDHEELKQPENRSDRYKLAFPEEYDHTEIRQLKLIRELEEELVDWRQRDARRAAREKEAEAEDRRRSEERARKEALPMYLRIEEAAVDDDLKEILHIFAEKLGLED